MARSLVTPPLALPVTLDQIKTHLKIETNADDAYLLELAAAAVGHVQAETGKYLVTQTWRIYLDKIPFSGIVELRLAPVVSVDAITVYDQTGIPSVIEPSQYSVDIVSFPSRICFASLPQSGQQMNGIEIDLVCGYGDTGADVPGQIVRAMLVLIAHWHEFRGSPADPLLSASVPPGFARLLAPFGAVRL